MKVNDNALGALALILLFLLIVLFSGEPDLLDAIISRVMKE